MPKPAIYPTLLLIHTAQTLAAENEEKTAGVDKEKQPSSLCRQLRQQFGVHKARGAETPRVEGRRMCHHVA
ncbi:MAG: hypothetical protein H8E44_23445 [Planctomycetes bacterium]|nr:hypothetical protein [Planctomycetota bacterium]